MGIGSVICALCLIRCIAVYCLGTSADTYYRRWGGARRGATGLGTIATNLGTELLHSIMVQEEDDPRSHHVTHAWLLMCRVFDQLITGLCQQASPTSEVTAMG